MLNSDCKYRDLVNCELLSELPLHAPNVNKFSESMLQKPWKNGTVCSIDETSKIDFYMCVTYLQNHKDFFSVPKVFSWNFLLVVHLEA